VVGDPTDEILAAAGRLFGELGVAGTTMSRLASESGLGQSSLYYYFRSRDEVVAALVARANVVPLALAERVGSESGSVASKLFRFVRGDVEALCSLPFDINEIHRVAARDREQFATYWRERSRLERKLSTLVREGIESGELRIVEPRLAALTILASDEGTQNWHRYGVRVRVRETAEHVAGATVAGLLAPGRALEDVLAEVEELDTRT